MIIKNLEYEIVGYKNLKDDMEFRMGKYHRENDELKSEIAIVNKKYDQATLLEEIEKLKKTVKYKVNYLSFSLFYI